MSILSKRLRRVGMSQRMANFWLVLVTMSWGISYVFLKTASAAIHPFEIIALRFTLAGFLCALIFRHRLPKMNKQVLMHGVVLGVIMFFCVVAILFGVQTTEASTASFLTSTAIVIVPVVQAVRHRRLPPKKIILGTLGTTTGIALLSLKGSLALSSGALLCIVSAFLYAAHIIATDTFSHESDAILLGVVQQATMAVMGWGATLLFTTPVVPQGATVWGSILGLSFICGAFAFTFQPLAQSFTTPEHTALIFSMEPVFGSFFAILLLGESLSLQASCGAALVLASVLLTTVQLPIKKS